jgi:predicted amidohydrolase
MRKEIFFISVFLVMLSYIVDAKNTVRVVTLGPTTPILDLEQSPQNIVDEMKVFWQEKIDEVLPYKPDLIVLPEACDRPRSMQVDFDREKKYYSVRKNQFLDFFADIAKANNTYVVYSYKRELEDGTYRNSSVLIGRDGKVVGIYDKNHPTIAEIDRGIAPGIEAPVFQCDFGKVGMLICFDMNFEELRERYEKEQPDILILSSRYQGDLMQKYWAHSVQTYFVSAVEGRPFLPSDIYDPLGDLLSRSNSHYLNFAYSEINLDRKLIHRDNNMEKMLALKKKYKDEVTIKDPGFLDVVLLSSNSDKLTVDDMMKEFDIESFTSYVNRSSEYRYKNDNIEK